MKTYAAFPRVARVMTRCVDCLSGRFTLMMLLAFLFITPFRGISQTVIGGTLPDPSAMLDVQSTDKGLLMPRMSTVQRSAIVSPATGLMIFNTTTLCLEINLGTPASPAWETLKCAPEPAAITSLACSAAIQSGTITAGQMADNASTVSYTGGNGGSYDAQTIESTGVTGLTAELTAGTLATGSGTLTYAISGVASAAGIANFSLSIGDVSCTLSWLVDPDPTALLYPAGTVFCASTPTAVVNVVNPTTGKTWMDRNLGASRVAQSLTDTASYGDSYQWGRRADGHQCRNALSTNVLSETVTPEHGLFITSSVSPSDWLTTPNVNLWQGVSGVNNPCPEGYRLPTDAELLAELNTWTSPDANGAFASPLKFTPAGLRSRGSGAPLAYGLAGMYWSSNPIFSNSKTLVFSLDAESGSINSSARAVGGSVRCIMN
jgi:hypothetical protein